MDLETGACTLMDPCGRRVRIPIYPAGYSDSNPATCSDPFPAIHHELMSAAV
jgi:hypothetical protein